MPRRARAQSRAATARIKTVAIDGWTALNAYVPPPERRGLVLIDPPFEADDDFARLAQALEAAHRKWPTGIYLALVPDQGPAGAGCAGAPAAPLGDPKVLRAEVAFAPPSAAGRLDGCGLIMVNPPWTLEGELAALLPALARILPALIASTGSARPADDEGGSLQKHLASLLFHSRGIGLFL